MVLELTTVLEITGEHEEEVRNLINAGEYKRANEAIQVSELKNLGSSIRESK